jgi:SP family facilitated glucose transporter-like MFS transporter 8
MLTGYIHDSHLLYTCRYNVDLFWLFTGTFTIYTIVAAFTVVFTSLWVPETKGRTLEEIQFSLR